MEAKNIEIVRRVNEGFALDDTQKILLYLAEDVRWEMPFVFLHVGKEAFRKEVDEGNFTGAPIITIKTEIAQGDHVVIEGEVLCNKKDGGVFNAAFVDIYRLENEKIKDIKSYIMEKK